MKCPFIKEVSEEHLEQKSENTHKFEQALNNSENNPQIVLLKEGSWRDWDF
jgi:hypothetical protein